MRLPGMRQRVYLKNRAKHRRGRGDVRAAGHGRASGSVADDDPGAEPGASGERSARRRARRMVYSLPMITVAAVSAFGWVMP